MNDLIEVKAVSKKYNDFTLDNVNFEVHKGKIIAIMGRNGNGKTTVIKSLLNLTTYEGVIKFFGVEYLKNEKIIKDRIGFVFEECPFDDELNAVIIEKVMRHIYSKWSNTKFFDYIRFFGIEKRKRLKEYSRGMQVKLMLAVALSHNPDVLILDEPTSGLDPISRKLILNELKKFVSDGNKSVVFSTHITSDLEQVVNEIILISNGKIVFNGELRKLLDKSNVVNIEEAVNKILSEEFNECIN